MKFLQTHCSVIYVKNFNKGFSGDYGIKLTLGNLHTLYELECPNFGVWWPSEGTLDVPMVLAIFKVITGRPGH